MGSLGFLAPFQFTKSIEHVEECVYKDCITRVLKGELLYFSCVAMYNVFSQVHTSNNCCLLLRVINMLHVHVYTLILSCIGTPWMWLKQSFNVIMPRCACASEVYCNRFVSVCVCVCLCQL